MKTKETSKTGTGKKSENPPKKESRGKKSPESAEHKKTPGEKETDKNHESGDKEAASLSKALEEKTKEAASHYEQLLRVRAESENYKKRQAKEQSQYLKYSNENLIKSLLPVISNLERANEAAKNNDDVKSLRVGVEMILKMFHDVLKNAGVEPVESMGKPLDPSRHEVISCMESEDHEENIIMQEFEKGYFLHDRLLCPAKVVVAKKPVCSPEQPDTEEKSSE